MPRNCAPALVGSLLLLSAAAPAQRPPLAEQARQLVQQMRSRGEPLGELHLAVAALYARGCDEALVIKNLRAARRTGVTKGRIDLVLGACYRRLGRYDAALSTFVRVLVEQREQPHALVQLWMTLYEAQLREITIGTDIDVVRERLRTYGLHLPARVELAADAPARSKKLAAAGYNALLAQRARYAAELFEAAIDALPSNARAHRGLAIARARQHDYARAAGAYLLYLQLAPDAADAAEVDKALMQYWRSRDR